MRNVLFHYGCSGYVLSRGALMAFYRKVQEELESKPAESVKRPLSTARGCGKDAGFNGEDIRFAICLQYAGMTFVDVPRPLKSSSFSPVSLTPYVNTSAMCSLTWVVGKSVCC